VSISLRIRSFDENQSSEAVREPACERWAETLTSWRGVLNFEFQAPEIDPPAERLEVSQRRSEVQPVDLTIVMESGNHADAHAVHVVGGPAQANGTPLEVPS
jgi:hypothetical protein